MRLFAQLGLIVVSIFTLVNHASADDRIIVTQPTDYWVTFDVPTQFLAQTYQSGDIPSDPQLWLYEVDTNRLIIDNDDYVGLQSKIDIELSAGSYRLRASTCCGQPDVWRMWDNTWNLQYELSYNGSQSNTTTTEVTTSLPPEVSTTTTQPELPTTTSSTTTETPTTWPETTTSTTSTTTSTTTAPTTNVPVTQLPTTTTTTTINVPSPTLLPTTTTTSTTTNSLAPTTTVTSTPSTSTPENTTTTVETTLPPINSETPIAPEQAVAYATNPETLAVATSEEANQIFDAIVVDELTDEQAAEIIAAVQNAPETVRNAFEEQINVFDGTFDNYIPVGSKVTVSQRRTLTITTVSMGVVAVLPKRKK